jgi:disulfide oxidoreductase YuzD
LEELKMAKSTGKLIKWLPDVGEHDYSAAESYLRIIYSEDKVSEIVVKFRSGAFVQFKAKDIFRASQLSLLGVSNSHVEKDRKKILDGERLSPLLLLRDQQNGKVVVADGYHRLCAIYSFKEDALIQCKIV